MDITSILNRLQLILNNQSKSLFSLNVDSSKEFLNSFEEPKDNIERSYFQYLCQLYLRNRVLNFFIKIMSAPLFYYFYYKYAKKKETDIIDENVDALFIPDGKDITLIPKSLINSIKNLAILQNEKYSLCKNDINFINNIKKRYPFDYEFLLKILIKIAKYRTAIYKYPNAKIIIVGSEYSYTSSILTEWCHNNGLRHINIMHGEKLFFIRDSFFYFDICYVWDDFYKKLFMNLRTPYQQFIVDKPPGLKFTNNVKVTKSYDYTYYLQGFETQEDLKKILEFLLILAKGTLNVSIRPHPRYSDLSSVVKIFDNKINVEDNMKISIEESIMRTKNVISLYSTVLTQAFYNDINIIIDDVSNKTRYEKLEKLQYRFIRSEWCRKLSEVIKENKNG